MNSIFCMRCGVGKIFKHNVVGHGSVLCLVRCCVGPCFCMSLSRDRATAQNLVKSVLHFGIFTCTLESYAFSFCSIFLPIFVHFNCVFFFFGKEPRDLWQVYIYRDLLQVYIYIVGTKLNLVFLQVFCVSCFS